MVLIMAKRSSRAQTQISREEYSKAVEEGKDAGINPDLLPYPQRGPTIDISDDEIGNRNFDYSFFNKETDFVIGGPLGDESWEAWKAGKFGKQRWFADWSDAIEWATKFYGARLKGRKPSEPGDTRKWAVIVRKETPNVL